MTGWLSRRNGDYIPYHEPTLDRVILKRFHPKSTREEIRIEVGKARANTLAAGIPNNNVYDPTKSQIERDEMAGLSELTCIGYRNPLATLADCSIFHNGMSQDGGVDITYASTISPDYDGTTCQVKATEPKFWPPVRNYIRDLWFLLHTLSVDEFRTDIGILAVVGLEEVWMLGWITREQFVARTEYWEQQELLTRKEGLLRKMCHNNLGTGWRLGIPLRDMNPMLTLKDYLDAR